MRLVRFIKDGRTCSGIVEGERVFELSGGDVLGCAQAYDPIPVEKSETSHNLIDVKLLAPVLPSKVIAIGLNYREHVAEFNLEIPDDPMVLLKPPTSVVGPDDDIIYPSHMSRRVDYEGELALVIAKKTKNVSPEEAKDAILGYTCFNDVTARDLQKTDVQYIRAKGFDTFSPMGPCIESDIDPLDVRIETYLNGEKRQDTSTSDMIFNVFEIVSFVSRIMTLLPGDVITTGTPSGIGKVKPGNEVEVRIDGIGSLFNTVVENDIE